MQTGTSETLIGWKSGQTTFVPLWDQMEGSWYGLSSVLYSETVEMCVMRNVFTKRFDKCAMKNKI
jgi:hypothetical protein